MEQERRSDTDAKIAVLEANSLHLKESLDDLKSGVKKLEDVQTVQHARLDVKLDKIEKHLSRQSGYIAGVVTVVVAFWSMVVLFIQSIWHKIV